MEIWKAVKGYEGMYEVSNRGNVRSVDRIIHLKNRWGGITDHLYKGIVKKPHVMPNGYVMIDLNKNGKHDRRLMHRLVGEHFLEKPDGKNYINHLDGNTRNNNVDNLEWCTQSENIQYAYNNGTKTPPHQKRIGQYDMNGILVNVWCSISEASRASGASRSNIRKVIHGTRNHAGGYKWQITEL